MRAKSEKEESRRSPATQGGRTKGRGSPSPPSTRPSRRINTTLDLDTVPGEAVASARALTGARYGVIVAVDEERAPQDLIFSGLGPVTHGFRSSFRDHADERTHTPHAVLAAALRPCFPGAPRRHGCRVRCRRRRCARGSARRPRASATPPGKPEHPSRRSRPPRFGRPCPSFVAAIRRMRRGLCPRLDGRAIRVGSSPLDGLSGYAFG